MLPAQFATERLIGRPPVKEDAAKIFAAWTQDQEVVRYMVWRPHKDVGETETWIGAAITSFGSGTRNEYVLAERESPSIPIGMISMRPNHHMMDFGYVVERKNWGRGFATEALRYLVEWALDQNEVHRAWAVCDVENLASARVMEKAGMAREGILRSWVLHPNLSPLPRDVYCYAKIKSV